MPPPVIHPSTHSPLLVCSLHVILATASSASLNAEQQLEANKTICEAAETMRLIVDDVLGMCLPLALSK
jgi:hypothetical protein